MYKKRYGKPKQCHYWAWLIEPIFGVHDSQGSAETLVRRGGITNNHLIGYSFINASAKNYQNRLMCVEVTVLNVSVVFFETRCIFIRYTVYANKSSPLEYLMCFKNANMLLSKLSNLICEYLYNISSNLIKIFSVNTIVKLQFLSFIFAVLLLVTSHFIALRLGRIIMH